jgi:hypothetical protein
MVRGNRERIAQQQQQQQQQRNRTTTPGLDRGEMGCDATFQLVFHVGSRVARSLLGQPARTGTTTT